MNLLPKTTRLIMNPNVTNQPGLIRRLRIAYKKIQINRTQDYHDWLVEEAEGLAAKISAQKDLWELTAMSSRYEEFMYRKNCQREASFRSEARHVHNKLMRLRAELSELQKL